MLNNIAFVIILIVVALAVRSLPNLPDLPVMPVFRPQPRRRTGPRAPRRRVQR